MVLFMFLWYCLLSTSMSICSPLCFPFPSIEALQEDLDGSVIISAAQLITPCNVAKPFSLLLTGPSLWHPSCPLCLSFPCTHTPLFFISSSISKELNGINGADGRVIRGHRSSQRAPFTGVYLRPVTLTTAKSTSICPSRLLGFCMYQSDWSKKRFSRTQITATAQLCACVCASCCIYVVHLCVLVCPCARLLTLGVQRPSLSLVQQHKSRAVSGTVCANSNSARVNNISQQRQNLLRMLKANCYKF